MTINEAIKEIQGKSAGITGRATVNYAEEQLFDGEKVFAAAPANIRSHHGNYPGIIVFTDKRLFAASGMPGIRRTIPLPLKELRECRDLKSPLSYTISLAANTDSYTQCCLPRQAKTTRPIFQLSKELSQGGTRSSLSSYPGSCPSNVLFRQCPVQIMACSGNGVFR